MVDAGIPEKVRGLIDEHIRSVVELEALLLLHANPGREWTAAELGQELRVDPAWAGRELEDLCHRGLVRCISDPMVRYAFDPSHRLSESVADLARVYAERRVSVISRIFSRPPSPAQSFADAFKLRREEDHG